MTNRFLAGAARADITPAVGTLLYGYRPDVVSTSVHDPLQVTALAVRQGEDTAVLLTVTVGDFQTELVDEIRGIMSEDTGIPASRLIVSATHTHSAPNVAGMEGWGGVDRDYVDAILFPAMRKVCREAVENLAPAEVAYGVTDSKVGINRRQQKPDGEIILGQNPWGCLDSIMTCIAIRNADTKAGILNLIHYGCHGTAAGCNHEISRDWSGIMTDRLEIETGTMTAFWNGSQGDVGPRLTNGATVGDIRHVEELGGVAAMDAMRAYKAIGGFYPGTLTIYEGDVKIPYKPVPALEEAQAKLAAYTDPEKLVNIDALIYAYYKAVEEVHLSGTMEDHAKDYVLPQTIVSIGDAAFVPFPFEIFSETSMRMREYAPFRHTLCLTNTNGYKAYLPTEDQICRGGYEILCFLYNSAYTLVNNADQVILDENLRLMRGE